MNNKKPWRDDLMIMFKTILSCSSTDDVTVDKGYKYKLALVQDPNDYLYIEFIITEGDQEIAYIRTHPYDNTLLYAVNLQRIKRVERAMRRVILEYFTMLGDVDERRCY
jgi:hypothetical protein